MAKITARLEVAKAALAEIDGKVAAVRDRRRERLLAGDAASVILGDALLAAAEHIGVLVLDAGLDLDRGLLLGGVEQGRLAPHRRKAIGILEIGEPAVALGLPTGDNVSGACAL